MIHVQNCNIAEFVKLSKHYDVYCFGSGRQADAFFRKYRAFNIEDNINGFIDNDDKKSGRYKVINNKSVVIYSFAQFLDRKNDKTIVLTTSQFFAPMIEQMDKEERLNGMLCYIDFFVENDYTEQKIVMTRGIVNIIPKVIHYCWFGGGNIPVQYQSYIDTWNKKCPDYKIMRWDETNYDIGRCKYMRQAYEAKKWAFVSDYARLDIIYEHGGIYLDTDVELLRNLDDLLYDDMFCGFERNNYINFGLGYGAVKGHPIIYNLLERYKNMDFFDEQLTPCVEYQHAEMMNFGFEPRNEYQRQKGVALYPSEVFAPLDLYGLQDCLTENTYSIHHYSSTWWEKDIEESNRYIIEKLMWCKKRIDRQGEK